MSVQLILSKLEEFDLDSMSHSEEGLRNHLIGTYDILKKWGCEEKLCLAGLCHSIYGTESYRSQTIPLSRRSFLKDLIGSEAEYLAYLFGAHVKDSLWKNLEYTDDFKVIDRFSNSTIKVSAEQFSQMVTLTLANWLEQRPRADKKYQFIRKNEFYNSQIYLPECAWKDFSEAYGIS